MIELKEIIEPALYLVPTPIGNLRDITLRAIDVLSRVDIVACEDTRTTGKLLHLLEIKANRLVSCHEHNEQNRAVEFAGLIKQGKSVAFSSDAGTPGISDPGYRLVNEIVKQGIRVIALPGASALLPAITMSGLPTNTFTFVGFPPQKKGRQSFLKKVCELDNTIIVYESPFRIEKLAEELRTICSSSRRIVFVRELTKTFEQVVRCTVGDAVTSLQSMPIKGEFVVVLEGNITE